MDTQALFWGASLVASCFRQKKTQGYVLGERRQDLGSHRRCKEKLRVPSTRVTRPRVARAAQMRGFSSEVG